MRKNWKKRALCAVLFILCTGLLGCGGSYQELSKGVDAPDFTAELNNHESFILSEQQGRVVLPVWKKCRLCSKYMMSTESRWK